MDQKRLRIIAAVVIGVCVAASTFLHLQHRESTEDKLVQTSRNLNARLPMNVDNDTRWDTTVPGPGKRLTYCYTFVNASKTELDPEKIAARIRPKLLMYYRTNAEMKLFRENRVTVCYLYKDKAGETVTSIEVSPDDL